MITLREEESPAVLPSDVANLVAAIEPVSVRCDEIHAGPLAGVDGESELVVDLGRGEPQYALAEEGKLLLVRLEHTVSCTSEGIANGVDASSTNISMAHVVVFEAKQPLETTRQTISAFIETNAYFIAYPYVRQLVSTLTGELGLPPVVLGFMKRDEWPFTEND